MSKEFKIKYLGMNQVVSIFEQKILIEKNGKIRKD